MKQYKINDTYAFPDATLVIRLSPHQLSTKYFATNTYQTIKNGQKHTIATTTLLTYRMKYPIQKRKKKKQWKV